MKAKSTVLHENEYGIKMIREDMVKRSAVKVYRGNDHLRTYRFNNVSIYEHPLLSCDNLDFCYGWPCDRDYLLTAVQTGKRLVARITYTVIAPDTPAPPSILITDDVDIWHNPVPRTHGTLSYWNILVARKGTLADFFDMDEIIAAFRKHDVYLLKKDLEPNFSVPLITLFQDEIWVNQGKIGDFVCGRLGLGYPIESTASILAGF